ncbi:hypothetical protein D3C84_1180310 [compost metagenome]
MPTPIALDEIDKPIAINPPSATCFFNEYMMISRRTNAAIRFGTCVEAVLF